MIGSFCGVGNCRSALLSSILNRAQASPEVSSAACNSTNPTRRIWAYALPAGLVVF